MEVAGLWPNGEQAVVVQVDRGPDPLFVCSASHLREEGVQQTRIIQRGVKGKRRAPEYAIHREPFPIPRHVRKCSLVRDTIHQILHLAAPRQIAVMIQHEPEQCRAGTLGPGQENGLSIDIVNGRSRILVLA